MLSVTYYYREPRKTGVSIEGIFRLVENCLKDKIDIKEFYCDNSLSRFQNTLKAGKAASEINHITGDVNFLALGLRGKKNVLTIHDLGHYETLKKRSFVKYLMYKIFWLKYPLKNISIVTVVSEFTKEKLIKYFDFPVDRIRLIGNPVKPIFQPVEKKTVKARPVILMMGTGKHKNLGNLIEAVKGLDVHLDIIGWPDTEEVAALKDNAISYSVYNRLSDEEVYQRYIACDILFMASFYEGFGMPIIEAQSVGRAVVTSNIGAMKEVAGESALQVNPHNTEEIKTALLSLIDNPDLYREMVKLGAKNIKPYQYKQIAEQYLAVYEELSK